MRFLLLLLLVSLSVESCWGLIARRADDKDFEVVANPHDPQQCEPPEPGTVASSSCSSTRNLDVLLEPYYLIPNVVPTQADTFQTLSHVKIMSVPVPTYHMKQPARLSNWNWNFNSFWCET
jgi:hypothetical protein